ncbi:unnamed protein product [Coregonus sp. 'balchen']|nr:unnamed protein product [Coregonus sp. 'balchen']
MLSWSIQVKLWRVCEPEQEQPGGAEVTLCPGEGRLELVSFHPTSSGLLAVGSTKTAQLWDASRQNSPLAALEPHGDQLQSLSWKEDGSLLASSCKVSKGSQSLGATVDDLSTLPSLLCFPCCVCVCVCVSLGLGLALWSLSPG